MTARSHIESLKKDEDFVSSFNAKLKSVQRDYSSPCLEWQGATDKSGYGRLHVKRHCEKKTGRNFFAHRMSYMLQTGAFIESDEYILHQCHNRLCCNADHFLLGDHQENMDDLHDSRRVAGENNSNSKLTEDEVWDILCLYYEEEGWTIAKLAEEFEVGRATITDVLYARTWKDLYNEFMGEDE